MLEGQASDAAPDWAAHSALTGVIADGAQATGARARMSARRSLRGRVLGPDGLGVGGAAVSTDRWVTGEPQSVEGADDVFHEGTRSRAARTDDDGAFEIEGLGQRPFDGGAGRFSMQAVWRLTCQ